MEAITYTDVNCYKIPDLVLPDDGLGEEVHIGIWGQRRLDYLKNHKRVLYSSLLMSSKLRAYLHEIIHRNPYPIQSILRFLAVSLSP